MVISCPLSGACGSPSGYYEGRFRLGLIGGVLSHTRSLHRPRCAFAKAGILDKARDYGVLSRVIITIVPISPVSVLPKS